MELCKREGEPLSVAEPKTKREPQELLDALGALGDVDKHRIRMGARKYAAVAGDMDEDDLLQETLMKIHEEKRCCPTDVDPLVFVAGVIRSLASSRTEWRKRREERRALEVTSPDYDLFATSTPDPNAKTPEEILVGEERDEAFQAFLSEQCNGCEKTELVLLGKFDGMRGKELCELAGVTEKELATILKRIARMMDRFEDQRRIS